MIIVYSLFNVSLRWIIWASFLDTLNYKNILKEFMNLKRILLYMDEIVICESGAYNNLFLLVYFDYFLVRCLWVIIISKSNTP